ncbi:adenosylcobinamide-GDP ribazoletransferase [Thermaerobacter composti]|uniref:Adenosylcobinamide-GDP ribazoletransferase n=1 Tax=Thermaerobacter composti TaxID=554949 RepID=A0ABZ0QQC2_9FIRM|nr:adenosylcobinamide-GDP ribazoletransferase [Thermaerobacter composti]WPD18712.1 adenosylcobinamide-GDP ribazoletransferase [Thermaerobacter composti]
MTAFWAALRFLTVLPAPGRRPLQAPALGRAVGYFPLVGVILGGLLAAANAAVTGVIAPDVRAVLVVGLGLALTGGLHFDGWLDTCDGLFGGHTPEERLRIMRDEHVGAFAVAGGGLLLLAKCAAVSNLVHPAATLVLASVLARWAVAVAIVALPYARTAGLGRAMKDHAGPREVGLATLFTVLVLVGVGMGLPAGREAVIRALVGALPAAAAVLYWARKRLPGLTGDVYGALVEAVETAVLLAGTSRWVGPL